MSSDHESPWKELLEQDSEATLSYFWPDIHADRDRSRDVESLEQEIRKLAPCWRSTRPSINETRQEPRSCDSSLLADFPK